MGMRVMLLGMLTRIDIDMNENILTRNLIRLVVFIASLMFFVNMMNGQVVFITDNQYNADYQVFVTDNRYEADWIVYITDNRYEARGGIMYVSSNRYTADYLIYFTSNRYMADRKIYYTTNKYEAKLNL